MVLIEQITLLIFLASLIGIFWLVYRKVPVLVGLPETTGANFSWGLLFSKIKKRFPVPKISFSFNFELFLQKTLSMVRVWTLKLESKTSFWLQHLREKAQAKKKFEENDKYWEDIGKTTKEK